MIPTLTAAPLPRLGEENFTFTVGNARPDTAATMWFGALAQPPMQVVPGVWLYLATLNTLSSAMTDSNGRWDITLAVPRDPILNGSRFHLQAVVLDPGGRRVVPGITVAVTNALTMTLGG